MSQGQAEREWDVHHRVLIELELAGRLLAIHIGNRVWYPRAQLVALLGEPTNGPATGPAKLSRSDNGRNQQSFDLDELAAA